MAILRIKRGLKGNLPTEAHAGEPLYATDTVELYIGNGTGQPLTKIVGGTGTMDHRELLYRNDAGAHEAAAVSFDATGTILTATETNTAVTETLGYALNIDGGVWG
jgi:hypothetical protein